MIVTTEIMSVACIMNNSGTDYYNPVQLISAIAQVRGNATGYSDTLIPIEGYQQFIKDVCNSFNTKPMLAPKMRQIDEDTKIKYREQIEVVRKEECENWFELFSFLNLHDLKELYEVCYAFRGKDFIIPLEFLDYFEATLVDRFELPLLELDEHIIKIIKSVGIEYNPKSIKEKLAYIALFIQGVDVIQTLPSVELSAVVNYTHIIDKVMKKKNIL